MERTFIRGPLYDRLKREFASYEVCFDRFMYLLLESLTDASGFALHPRGYRILITPRLTKHFGLNEREIREIAYAMRDFYEKQGMAKANIVSVGLMPSVRSKRGRKPKQPYPRDNTELFGISYSESVSFSDWLLNHADERYRKYFSKLLDNFSKVRETSSD